MKPERVFAAYLALQAVGGIAFWVALASSDTVREVIELLPEEHAVTDAFIYADLLVGVLGSAVGAFALATGRRWALPIIAFTCGGLVYPTLFLLGWVSFTGEGAPCLAVMVPPSILTCWVTYQTWRMNRPALTV